MGVVESLAAWGILRAAEVVELARAEGLDLAAAATCLEKESSGGHNVWGSDVVQTGGAYVKGAEVTKEAYLRYRALQDAGQIGAQGVGPGQLTYPPLQRAADAIGGCWDWRANVRISFRNLAQLQRQYGRAEGFRRYNGSGPLAEKYKADAEAKYARWVLRLGSTTAPAAPAAQAPGRDWFDMATEDDLRRIITEVVDARLTPIAQKVELLTAQMVTGQATDADPRWGWDGWGGGSGERLTVVDYLRRSNVEIRQAWNAVNSIGAAQDAELSGMSKQIGELVAEVRGLAAAGPVDVAAAGIPQEFAITGTARPIAS